MRTLCIVLVCVMFFSSKVTVYGNDSVEELEGYDFSDIDKLLSSEEHEESFGELFKELIQGDSTDVFKRMFSMVGDKLFGELSTNKGVIIRIVLLAIGAALLSKLSIIFAGSKMSDMGFFAVFSVPLTAQKLSKPLKWSIRMISYNFAIAEIRFVHQS